MKRTIWIPCNFINFGFMPNWARIPFMATCSMAFCVVLSVLRGQPEPTEQAKKVFSDLPNVCDDRLLLSIRDCMKQLSPDCTHSV